MFWFYYSPSHCNTYTIWYLYKMRKAVIFLSFQERTGVYSICRDIFCIINTWHVINGISFLFDDWQLRKFSYGEEILIHKYHGRDILHIPIPLIYHNNIPIYYILGYWTFPSAGIGFHLEKPYSFFSISRSSWETEV